ncbi:bifunctional DNA-formamidopyrimidine glycosylase/DNA-(apurinic or apyrimidinic site) lyase [Paenibacillus sp. PR3]|uniref:Formamidopyrimidine-DNA glycosylase n=1 Tax=Paenibacillus terricola TaxID=2763503 RepID=A0ABR8MSJ0_9BACL|nr:bifunctional DNA-formamidopyrimidine glycosylase/DNA-(apurinic or apyrimidinic site) lyase [Paenibacillus terricola]MBD3918942.1 bifunctional DNA-formamidopyrimidine glycosylase/DNA-(apurinic or apyrimidinic site) lyase [Paenibacillus terricola]
MPELPEMETYRKLLSERIAGRTITGVVVTRDKTINMPPEQFIEAVVGRVVWFVERRGKHLLLHLDDGRRLIIHLMLGGSLYYGDEEDRPDRNVQVELSFGEHKLFGIGLRLGYVHLVTAKEAIERFQELGPEPLDTRLTVSKFKERFKGKRGALKTALVDQHTIAGIGNCYADEICFIASIRPTVRIPALKEDDWERLFRAMQSVLREATAYGGYMDAPFTREDTLTGGFDERCRVYDRVGEPCVQCGTAIERGEVATKKVFYCPTCQPEG